MRKLLFLGVGLITVGILFFAVESRQKTESADEISENTSMYPPPTRTVPDKSRRPETGTQANSPTVATADVVQSTPFDDVLARAVDFANSGKKEEARRELEQALAKDPDNSELLLHVGEFYSQELGQPKAAIEVLQKSYLKDPSNDRALKSLSDALTQNGDLNLAVQTLSGIRQQVPDRLEPALALTDLYLDAKRPGDALNVLRSTEKGHPTSAQVQDRFAEAYGRQKDYVNESRSLNHAVALTEQDILNSQRNNQDTTPAERARASFLVDLAATYADQGRAGEARDALKKIQTRYLPKEHLPLYERLVGSIAAD